MRFQRRASQRHATDIDMTPMIDVVFQLQIFFILTFKIVAPEGDFNIKMPLAGPSATTPLDQDLPPLRLRMEADASGQLAGMSLNQTAFDSFDALHQHVIGLIGNDRGPDSFQESAQLELDFDPQLHYRFVIDAITAVSGVLTEDGQIVKLIDKIKFAPPRGSP